MLDKERVLGVGWGMTIDSAPPAGNASANVKTRMGVPTSSSSEEGGWFHVA